ncbi:MAG: amino acid synthesis family protein [Nitriliruptoraceae bacterium]|nr:amino acid synthesis family protein [Nitriliruptoraceae bacterium]
MSYDVRKWFGLVEEINHDGGPAASTPLRKAVVAAVVANPYAGRYSEELDELIDPSPELALELTRRGRTLLSDVPIESFGKGGIAGSNGEQEHVVACLTTLFGDALREGVGGGEAWVSSATKVGAPGEPLDLPLAYKDALFVRSHYDAITFRIPDAPRPDELVLAISLATGGRPHHRVGGLRIDEVQGGGLR